MSGVSVESSSLEVDIEVAERFMSLRMVSSRSSTSLEER